MVTNSKVPGNGGLECRDHVSFNRRVLETMVGMGVPLLFYSLHMKTSNSLQKRQKSSTSAPHETRYSFLRLILLISLSFVFGIEVGFKLATKQLIWLFNPCHVTSMIQMYLLAAPVESLATNLTIYRVIKRFFKIFFST